MKKIIVVLSLSCFSFECFSQTPLHPFPQHYQYTTGSILPSNHTQTQLDNNTKTFYDQWKAVYLKNDCAANQYYVWFQENPQPSTICVSEGQGYGMVITAYMAGYDANAKTYFDGLYNFYKAHPSVNNSYLMAWDQVNGCMDDPNGGNDGATDGDMDIAYGLLLAHYQWGSGGTINYLAEAINIINAIKQDDVNPSIWTSKLGDWAFSTDPMYYDTRPSDFMMDHFRVFQTASGSTDWTNVTNECYSLINNMQTNFSSASGLLPDFIVHCNTTPTPAAPNYLEGPEDGFYSYNACRTPWRIGTDYLVSGDPRAKAALDKINAWVRTKTSNTPSNIQSGYKLTGATISGDNYESEAFIAPFAIGAMDSTLNQTWLNSVYDELLSMQLSNTTYYENTIKMQSLIVLSSNWWVPKTLTTGIQNTELANTTISIYPNPGTEQLFVKSDAAIKSVSCINYLGQSTNLKLDNKSITISGLSCGIYFLIFTTETGERITKKFTKNN
jgi:endo-1,4-beta-D-glucanase Y